MKEWYPLILVCVPTKCGGCNLESSATKFLNAAWLGMVVFHSDMYATKFSYRNLRESRGMTFIRK